MSEFQVGDKVRYPSMQLLWNVVRVDAPDRVWISLSTVGDENNSYEVNPKWLMKGESTGLPPNFSAKVTTPSEDRDRDVLAHNGISMESATTLIWNSVPDLTPRHCPRLSDKLRQALKEQVRQYYASGVSADIRLSTLPPPRDMTPDQRSEMIRRLSRSFSMGANPAVVMGMDLGSGESFSVRQLVQTCPDCKGSGKYIGLQETDDCATCRGKGTVTG